MAALAWSVVIPAYNEAARLPRYLSRVLSYFDDRGEPYEVLVVDDGSGDDTGAHVRALGAEHRALHLHTLPENRGKGHAVRAGMRLAQGALRLMTDADGATPIVEVKRLEAALHEGADVAIGSRARRDPSVVVQARRHRQVAGRLFHQLVRGLGVSGIADSQCGFKLFRGPVADDLFAFARTDGFGFDVELLLLARRREYRVAEVPINWADQAGSKVGLVRDGLRMASEILAARARIARVPRRVASIRVPLGDEGRP
ncbi:MAG: glycosyltransferase family 2 protein [Candidatus Rokubacteria bacterium]|nr:glycosyltransferase family 2 protein [Candidatus Rokubacteria bacterium]